MRRRRGRQPPDTWPCNPGGEKAAARIPSPVWPRPPFARRYSGDLAVDFFSSGYLDVSVPRVVLPQGMCSQGGCQDLSWRVRPFGDPRVEGCVPLTADYRSLPRPSSASRAKASAVRPAYLLICRVLVPYLPAPVRGPGQNHTARGACPGRDRRSMSTAPSDRGTLSCGHVSQNRLDDFRDDSHLARPAPDLVGGGPGRPLPARLAMRLSRYAGIPRGPGTAGGAADGRTGRVLRLKVCLPIPGSSSP